MQNELKTFLEKRYQSVLRGEVLDTRESDRVLVNKVLEMVKKEVEDCRWEHNEARHGDTTSHAYDRIENLLNNLTI